MKTQLPAEKVRVICSNLIFIYWRRLSYQKELNWKTPKRAPTESAKKYWKTASSDDPWAETGEVKWVEDRDTLYVCMWETADFAYMNIIVVTKHFVLFTTYSHIAINTAMVLDVVLAHMNVQPESAWILSRGMLCQRQIDCSFAKTTDSIWIYTPNIRFYLCAQENINRVDLLIFRMAFIFFCKLTLHIFIDCKHYCWLKKTQQLPSRENPKEKNIAQAVLTWQNYLAAAGKMTSPFLSSPTKQ